MYNRRLTSKLHHRHAVAGLLAAAGSLLVSAGSGASWPSPASAQAVGGRAALTTPNPSTTDNELTSVSADSSTDGWAVGYYGTGASGSGADNTLTVRWNGSTWAKVTSPNPLPGQTNQLSGVYARSASDAWAVGSDSSASTPAATLILRWNGSKWAKVPSPDPGASGNELTAVSGDAANDAWAVGTILASGGVTDTLILHWNGMSWSQVSSPTPQNSYLNLAGVTAISSSDAWAVGTYFNNTTNTYDTLTLHWNGSHWSEVSSLDPAATGENRLNAVSAHGAGDVWAVGTLCSIVSGVCAFSDESTLIMHWNGKAWSQVPSPSPSTKANFLKGVSADPASAKDAWAVGWYTSTTGADDTLTLRWNGIKWSQVTAPNPSASTNFLQAVATVSNNDALAAGEESNASSVFDTLGLHWNGTKWAKT
jgi:hypothetical protein